MSQDASSDEQHRLIADAMNEASPQARALGFQTLEIGGGVAILKVPYRPEIIGDPETGVIAGGVVTTLLDHASGQAVHAAMSEWVSVATLDLRMESDLLTHPDTLVPVRLSTAKHLVVKGKENGKPFDFSGTESREWLFAC